MLESMLLQGGYRVGLYTSPHLLHFNERARVNGELATDAMLCECFEQVEAVRGEVDVDGLRWDLGEAHALREVRRRAEDLVHRAPVEAGVDPEEITAWGWRH